MAKFSLVATGGTFDIIHSGHRRLLSEAFGLSSMVIIGLTSAELAKRKGKEIQNSYTVRLQGLFTAIRDDFPDCKFEIHRLDDDFGPAVLKADMQALIVSEEMKRQGSILNELRAKNGLLPVEIVTVPMLLAKDGRRISTTRIKNSEIDTDGNLLSVDQ